MDLHQLNDHGAYHEARRLVLGEGRRSYVIHILAFAGDAVIAAWKAAIATVAIGFWSALMYWDGPLNMVITEKLRQVFLMVFLIVWVGILIVEARNSILNRNVRRIADLITARNLAVNEIKDQA